MAHPRFTPDEVARLGELIYDRDIAPIIDKEANLGKLLSIDVETGDYEIGDDDSIDAPLRLNANLIEIICTWRGKTADACPVERNFRGTAGNRPITRSTGGVNADSSWIQP